MNTTGHTCTAKSGFISSSASWIVATLSSFKSKKHEKHTHKKNLEKRYNSEKIAL